MNDVQRSWAEHLALTEAATGPVIRLLLAHIDQLEARVLEQERTRALGGIPPETDHTWGNTPAPVEIHPDYQGRI